MELATNLTESEDGHAGLSLAVLSDDHETPSATYRPDVLGEWADELSDVDEQVEVSIRDVKMRSPHRQEDSALALVGRVPDSDVVCFAAPLLIDEPEEDDQDGDEETETSLGDYLPGLPGWLP